MDLGHAGADANIRLTSDGIDIKTSSPILIGGRSTSTPIPKSSFKTRIPVLVTPASSKKSLPLVEVDENIHHDKSSGYCTVDDKSENKENLKKTVDHLDMQGLMKIKTNVSGAFTSSAGSNVVDKSGEKIKPKLQSGKKRRSRGLNVTPKCVSRAPKLLTALRAEMRKNRTPVSLMVKNSKGFSTVDDSTAVKKNMTGPQTLKKHRSKKKVTVPRTPKFVRRYYLSHPEAKK